MNAPKCTDMDYIHFLLAAQTVFSCTEAANSQPALPDAPAHNAFTRLLQRQPPAPAALGCTLLAAGKALTGAGNYEVIAAWATCMAEAAKD